MPSSTFLIATLLLATASFCVAFPMVRVIIPNGYNVRYRGIPWPGVGHLARFGAGPLNPFGMDFYNYILLWNRTFCMLDSDGDGFTNGQELGDPSCVFNQQRPGDFVSDAWTLVSHPGFNDSTPLPAPNTVTAGFTNLLNADYGALQSVAGGFTAWTRTDNPSMPACVGTTFGRYSCDLSARGVAPFLNSALNFTVWPQGVESLAVESQGLFGGFPGSQLTRLPLINISFRNNSLSGLPDLANLPATLQTLDLSLNKFTGVLNLSTVVLPTSLRLLNLSGNPLTAVVLNLNQAAATTRIILPALPTTGATMVSCICGSAHAAVDLATLSISGGPTVPSSCSGCIPGLSYDLSTVPCKLLTATPTILSPIPAVATAVRGNSFSAYCDSGCTAALAIFILVLVAVVVVALVLKLCSDAEDDKDDAHADAACEREPIIDREQGKPPTAAPPTASQTVTTTTSTTRTVVTEEQRVVGEL